MYATNKWLKSNGESVIKTFTHIHLPLSAEVPVASHSQSCRPAFAATEMDGELK